MNIIVNIPAGVAASIVACRSFVSLTNFLAQDVYVYPATSPTRFRSGEGSGLEAPEGGSASDGNLTKKRRDTRSTISGTSFSAGIDSFDQVYNMDEFHMTRTPTPLAAADTKYGHDFGGGNNTEQVAVHLEALVYDHNGVQSVDHINLVDLESRSH